MPSYVALKVSSRVARGNIKIYIEYFLNMVSFWDNRKTWATPRLFSFRGLIQSFQQASLPPGFFKWKSLEQDTIWKQQVHVA